MKKKLNSNSLSPFGVPYLYRFYTSNNSQDFVLIANVGDSFQVYTYSVVNKILNPITKSEKGNLIANISSDGRFAFIYDDLNGNETGHWFRVNISTGEKTNLTHGLDGYAAFCLAVSKKNYDKIVSWALLKNVNCIIFISNTSSANPETHVLYKSKNVLTFPVISDSGKNIAFVESDLEIKYLNVFQTDSLQQLKINLGEQSYINPVLFKNENELLITRSNGKNKRIYILDYLKKIWTELPINIKGDLDIIDYNNSNSLLLFSCTNNAKVKIYLFDFSQSLTQEIGLNSGNYDFFLNGGYVMDDQILLRWQSGDTPPQIHSIKIDNFKNKVFLNLNIQKSNFSTFESILIDTPNGKVQAWLMAPDNDKKPIPMIIDLHGGPHSCVFDEFIPEAQNFMLNGYGICYVNFHGSSTFGTEFENSIIGSPGHKEVVDAVSVKNFLVEKGIADKTKCYLQGWSWGGFASLLAAGTNPSEFRGFVSIMGVGDLIASYEEQHAYLRSFDDLIFKGTPNQARENYIKSSPISYVDSIKAPLLIIHGKKDLHCPAKQMQNFIDKLTKLNKKMTVHWYDFGHLEMYSSNKIREMTSKNILEFYNSI